MLFLELFIKLYQDQPRPPPRPTFFEREKLKPIEERRTKFAKNEFSNTQTSRLAPKCEDLRECDARPQIHGCFNLKQQAQVRFPLTFLLTHASWWLLARPAHAFSLLIASCCLKGKQLRLGNSWWRHCWLSHGQEAHNGVSQAQVHSRREGKSAR